MVKAHQVRRVVFKGEKLRFIQNQALRLSRGGESTVYTDPELRNQRLGENQLTGQSGEAAAITVCYDFDLYRDSVKKKNPFSTDYGNDIPGASLPIDVKSFNVKMPLDETDKLLNCRKLLVSKEEHNSNSVYIACAVPQALSINDKIFEVAVIGWCWGREMLFEQWVNHNLDEERECWRLNFRKLEPMHRMPFEHRTWWGLLERKAA
jgi:hypothetical protein